MKAKIKVAKQQPSQQTCPDATFRSKIGTWIGLLEKVQEAYISS